jgi:hypothetical protein
MILPQEGKGNQPKKAEIFPDPRKITRIKINRCTLMFALSLALGAFFVGCVRREFILKSTE